MAWKVIGKYFRRYPAQEKVAKLMLEYGLCVREGEDRGVYCRDIRIPAKRIAEACGVDRRMVLKTVETILEKPGLRKVYTNLNSTAFLADVAPAMGWGVVEIIPEDAAMPGIVAGVTGVAAKRGISVRQCIAEDPEFSEKAKLYVVTEKPVPPELIPEMGKVRGVKAVTVR
jgi:predicted regulator of amino acid metabolism with ACT domain